ncbi:sigma-54-dependent transcriptional regulator [Yoonia sp. R2331]|uniref:sigma-54-dependent transcriptional regulator n=1 Tax=Yoonia sp. R2331 TaxID=3237238 RepID=UPI0034E54F65
MTRQVLLVDDDMAVREALGQTLELADCTPVLAGSFVAAKDHITPSFPGVIVSDMRMPGRDGFHLLNYALTVDPELPVIILTGQGDIPMAVQAMEAGAFSFLEKPCAPATLIAGVERALEQRGMVLDNRRMKLELDGGDAAARMLFGISDLSKGLRDRVRQVARTGADVLVTGEPGSGTPKVAEVIHLLSAAARHPFVKRSSAGLNAQALQDALAQAGAGTLYLDEVWALADEVQFALLDAFEAGPAARVVAGSTQDLRKLARSGTFSRDLAVRLDLLTVRVPALRERMEDVPVLFRHYVAQACEQANLPVREITQADVDRQMAKDWPGNARALMNAAMRFALGVDEDADRAGLGLSEQLARVERSLLIEALRATGGNATDTAKSLKLARKTFYDKLAKHGLRAEDYRLSDG